MFLWFLHSLCLRGRDSSKLKAKDDACIECCVQPRIALLIQTDRTKLDMKQQLLYDRLIFFFAWESIQHGQPNFYSINWWYFKFTHTISCFNLSVHRINCNIYIHFAEKHSIYPIPFLFDDGTFKSRFQYHSWPIPVNWINRRDYLRTHLSSSKEIFRQCGSKRHCAWKAKMFTLPSLDYIVSLKHQQ